MVVTAAGNGNRGVVDYPALESDSFAVAATDPNDRKTDYSNYNSKVDITAPGDSILSLYSESAGGYATWSGTSMSAPFVSGAAALAIQAHPSFTAEAIENLLSNSAKDISSLNPLYSGKLGAGRLDIGALMGLLPAAPPPVPSGSALTTSLLAVALMLLRARDASGKRRPALALRRVPAEARRRTN